jgi:hypothetical protein
MRTIGSLAVVALALTATPAFAQLVLAPPIVGKTVSAPEEAITRALQDELAASGIRPVELTMQLVRALEKCKNKMSCLASDRKSVV